MNEKKELEDKIKKILVILKSIDKKKETITDSEEVEKLVRMKSYLVKELKEHKEELQKFDILSELSNTIKDDENKGAKAFKKNSLKEGKVKKIRYSLILFLILYTTINFGLIFQKSFYNSAIIKKSTIETSVENFYFIWKFLITIAIIWFTIYIINAKYFKNKPLINYLVYPSLILGYISYLHMPFDVKFIENFMSGKGLGIIPGIIGLVATFFLIKNITYIRKKRYIKIKKKKD